MRKELVAILASGAIFLGGCAGQNYQSPKKPKVDYDQYFPETTEEKGLRRDRERFFKDALTETGRADTYSAAQIACNAISKKEGTSGSYVILEKRFNDCIRAQTR